MSTSVTTYNEPFLELLESVFDEPEFASLQLYAFGCHDPKYMEVSLWNGDAKEFTEFLVEVSGRDEDVVKDEVRDRIRLYRDLISEVTQQG